MINWKEMKPRELLFCIAVILSIVGGLTRMGHFSFAQVQEEPILQMIEKGILKGDETGDLKLQDPVTRAQMAAFISRYLGQEKMAQSMSYDSTFSDVKKADWYAGYVNLAYGHGLIQGYGDGTFRPNQHINFAEALTLCVRMVEAEKIEGPWPAAYVIYAQQKGILKGLQVSDLSADIQRKDVLFMLYNISFSERLKDNPPAPLKGLVIENDRVESLSANKIIVEIISAPKEKYAHLVGKEFEYTAKDKKQAESLLGKVVEVHFEFDKIHSIEPLKGEALYVDGKITELDLNRIKINGQYFTVRKEERNEERDYDTRLYQAYLDGRAIYYPDLLKENIQENFARVTVQNGKVIFMEVFTYQDRVPVCEIQGERIYYYDNLSAAKKFYEVINERAPVFEIQKTDLGISLVPILKQEIKINDILYKGDYGYFRYAGMVSGKADKIRGLGPDGNGSIFVSQKEYKINFNKAHYGPVYRVWGGDFRRLYKEDFVEELQDIAEEQAILLLDHENYVHSISAQKKEERYFVFAQDFLGSSLQVLDENNSKKELRVKVSTKIYEADLEELNHLIEEKETFDSLKEIEFGKLKKNTLYLVEVKPGTTEIEAMVQVNITKAWFSTDTFNKEFIQIQEAADDRIYAHKEYDTDKAKVFALRKNKVEVYTTIQSFFSRYKVSNGVKVVCAILPYRSDQRSAEVIFVKPDQSGIDEIPVETREVLGQVQGVEKRENQYHLTWTDVKGQEITRKITGPQGVKMAADGIIKPGDLVKIQITKDKFEDVREISIVVDADSQNVYKVLALYDGYMTLGFGQHPDTEIDGFKASNTERIRMSSAMAFFGEVREGDFVRIYLSEEELLMAAVKAEKPKDLAVASPFAAKGKIYIKYQKIHFVVTYIYTLDLKYYDSIYEITSLKVFGRYYSIEDPIIVVTDGEGFRIEVYSNNKYIGDTYFDGKDTTGEAVLTFSKK